MELSTFSAIIYIVGIVLLGGLAGAVAVKELFEGIQQRTPPPHLLSKKDS